MDTANLCPPTRRGTGPNANLVFRVFALAGLGGISGLLFYGHTDVFIGAIPLWLYAGGVYAGFVGVSAALIFMFFPRLRQFIELTALSRFILAMVSFWVPEVAETMTTSAVLNATLVVGGALILRQFLRGWPRLQVGV